MTASRKKGTGVFFAADGGGSPRPPCLYRAAWVLPVASPPIRAGWVAVGDGRVAGVGAGDPPRAGGGDVTDLGDVAVLPGLVNAHTHLELSSLRGRVAPAATMPAWVCDLIAARGLDPPALDPIRSAIAEAHASGTAVVADIGNSLATIDPLAQSPVSAVVFHELLGFNLADPAGAVATAAAAIARAATSDRVRVSLAVHAPYSCSPGLIRAVRDWLDRESSRPTSVHLAESPEELRFLRDGTGPWRDLLGALRAWTAEWQPPGTDPVSYLESLRFLDDRVLAVHGVHLDDGALGRLAARGATLVTCPRSNQWVGAGVPPVARFYRSGVRVAIGTDSLASAPDLSLFAELAAIRRLAPDVPARALLDSATRAGAEALGFGPDLGTIEPGKRAALVAVRIPAGVADVEEYLLTGISPSAVRWLPA